MRKGTSVQKATAVDVAACMSEREFKKATQRT